MSTLRERIAPPPPLIPQHRKLPVNFDGLAPRPVNLPLGKWSYLLRQVQQESIADAAIYTTFSVNDADATMTDERAGRIME